jgi:ADP-heptose:LPS heptosyltransferase
MPVSNHQSYRRVLITRMKFIGDIVLTTPIIHSARLALPGAYIAYLGERHALTLLERNPYLDETIPFDFSKPAITEQTRVGWLLRRRAFDLVIDLFGNPRSALLARLTGASTRIGLDRKGRGALYTIRVADDGKRRSAIEFHERFLEAAGLPAIWHSTEIFLSEEERRSAREFLFRTLFPEGGSSPLVALHAGATWPAKRWLPERFARLAGLLHRELGARVLLTEGPHDGEVVEEVLRSADTPLFRTGVLPLRMLAAILTECSALVSNDAGPMHIAAALGTPTVGIFGPGEEEIWFPYRAEGGYRALRKDVPCHPCHLDFCNRRGEEYMECMKLLHEREVCEAVILALRAKKGDSLR